MIKSGGFILFSVGSCFFPSKTAFTNDVSGLSRTVNRVYQLSKQDGPLNCDGCPCPPPPHTHKVDESVLLSACWRLQYLLPTQQIQNSIQHTEQQQCQASVIMLKMAITTTKIGASVTAASLLPISASTSISLVLSVMQTAVLLY